MNKFLNYIFALTAIVALGFLSSCSDDDETPAGPNGPSISLSTDNGEHESGFSGYVGDSISWTINVNAPGKFNTLNIYRQEDGDAKGTLLKTFSKVSGTFPTEFNGEYGYKIQENDVDETVYLLFEAVDESQTSTLKYEIKAQERPTKQYTTKLLYAPNENLKSKTFFSVSDGETYSINDVENTSETVSGKIDFGYYYRNNNQHTLSSPKEYPTDIPGHNLNNWKVKNETLFRTTDITTSEFLEYQNDVDFINEAFENGKVDENGINPGRVTQLKKDQVLAFEIPATKKRGLIKIIDIKGTTGLGDHITIDVVVVD